MNNAELREFCTQMIGKFKLLSDIQKEMQYETINAKFTEWELKKLIFALNVLREEVRKYVDTADTPQTETHDLRTETHECVKTKKKPCSACKYYDWEWDEHIGFREVCKGIGRCPFKVEETITSEPQAERSNDG